MTHGDRSLGIRSLGEHNQLRQTQLSLVDGNRLEESGDIEETAGLGDVPPFTHSKQLIYGDRPGVGLGRGRGQEQGKDHCEHHKNASEPSPCATSARWVTT